MFSKPNVGWVDINIGGYTMNGSYLTDIPMDFLDSLISSLKSNLPVSVFIDEEGIENIICAYYDEVYIIAKHGDDVEYIKKDMDFNLFRKDIVNDIETNLNEWINWNLDEDVKVLKNRKNDLNTKLSIAKKYLKYIK